MASKRYHFLILSYVDVLTEMRKNAQTKTEKTWYKMLVNALFGKFLQNNEKYTIAKVHRTRDSLRKSLQSPYHISYTVISPDFIITFERPKDIRVDKPMLMG